MCCYSAGSADAGGRAPRGSLGRRRKRCRGRWPWRSGSGAGQGMDSAVSCCWRVSHEIGEVGRNFGNGRHGAESRIEEGRRGERR